MYIIFNQAFPLRFFVISWLLQYSNLAVGDTRAYFDAKHALIQKLTNMSDTVKQVRPVIDINSAVNVKLRFKLRQLATVDEKNQAIRLTVWLKFEWNNPFLQWDPQEYQTIDSVHVENDLFWVPDVALFNEVSLEEEIEVLYKRLATKLVITNDGNCTWNAPATLLTQCRIDVTRFPFDKQTCYVSIGSWTYGENQINITYHYKEADLYDFIPNGEWDVVSAVLDNKVTNYGYRNTPHPDVTLTLNIQRRYLFYTFNLLVPCALISILALLAFILPTDHGERIGLVITVLLANTVYMLIVSDSLPETSYAVPTLSAYFLGLIVEISCCLLAACFTFKIRDQKTRVPHWVNVLVLRYGARFVCLKFDGSQQSSAKLPVATAESDSNDDRGSPSLHAQDTRTDGDIPLATFSGKSKDPDGNLLDEVRLLTQELRCKQAEDVYAKDWKHVAKVLNRIFSVMFLVIYLCLLFYLLANT